MELPNTFVYDPASPTAATDFQEIIDKNDILLLVMGNDALAQKAVQEGDIEAGNAPFGVLRRVVSLPDHTVERQKCLDLLATMPQFDPANYEKVLAFSLTHTTNHTAHVILRSDITSDTNLILRIQKAFWEAGDDIGFF